MFMFSFVNFLSVYLFCKSLCESTCLFVIISHSVSQLCLFMLLVT